MAKIDPSNRMKDRKEHGGGGGGNYPTFTQEEGTFPYTCLSIAHTRSKKGRWGIAFLFLCVSGPHKGTIMIHKCWTEDFLHDVIAGAYGFNQPYEGGLPDGHTSWDKFNADPDLLNEMIGIVSCLDQRVTKGPDAGKWLPGVPIQSRRSPYVLLKIEKPDKYTEVKYVNPSKKIGTDGPFFVEDWRDARADKEHVKLCVDYFATKCAKEVRDAFEALRNANGGGGDEHTDGGGDFGYEEEVPF